MNTKLLEGCLTEIDNCLDHLSLEESLEFLEQLSTDIECRIDGIKDDMKFKE